MGKKSKGLASKFAKMSDDQRAKYMQLKADQEEEIRRRKEQLLNTFMKNKIRKEDVFSRLNKAKINLEWHQFLRIRKCKEMKENCEHSRRWIERTVVIKNNTIDGLIKELDEAEFQYSNNLQSNLLKIDEMIDFFNKYSTQLKVQFDRDLQISLDNFILERKIINNRSESDLIHLKTIIFGQEIRGECFLKEDHDYYLKRLDQFIKNYREDLNQLKRSKENLSGLFWNKISSIVKLYVDQTDKRRAQLAEMRKIDVESCQEINKNREKILEIEAQIQKYKDEHKTLIVERTESINLLKNQMEDLNKLFLRLKIGLKKDLDRDECKLRFLSERSKEAFDHLKRLERKGEFLLNLAQSCRKYETQKEKVLRFFKEDFGEIEENEEYFVEKKEKDLEIKVTLQEQLKEEIEEEISQKDSASSSESSKEKDQIYQTQTYKILIKQKFGLKPRKSLKLNPKLEKELESLDLSSKCPKRKRQSKKTESFQTLTQKNEQIFKSNGIVEDCTSNLAQLEGFWNIYNKVKIDCGDLRTEKAILQEENVRLKSLLRSILEEAVLESRNVQRNHYNPKIRYFSAPVRYT